MRKAKWHKTVDEAMTTETLSDKGFPQMLDEIKEIINRGDPKKEISFNTLRKVAKHIIELQPTINETKIEILKGIKEKEVEE